MAILQTQQNAFFNALACRRLPTCRDSASDHLRFRGVEPLVDQGVAVETGVRFAC